MSKCMIVQGVCFRLTTLEILVHMYRLSLSKVHHLVVFTIVHSVIMKVMTCPHAKLDFSGIQKQFWLDAIPDATSD